MRQRTKSFTLHRDYERRVFVGGCYHDPGLKLLNDFARVVRQEGFVPVIAADYPATDAQIHDLTLAMLHACPYAVFEVSAMSGALMEVERIRDYGTQTLLLYRGASTADWSVSRMLKSFVRQEDPMVRVFNYVRPATASEFVRIWLQGIKRITI